MKYFLLFTTFSLQLSCTPKNTDVFSFSKGGQKYSIKKDETLVANVGVFSPSFNWYNIELILSFVPIENAMSGLTEYSFKNGRSEIRPGIASHWEVSKGGAEWTFTLRKDAYWSDGQPVPAQHFVDGWFRALDPKIGSNQAGNFFDIKNAENYLAGKVDKSQVGIKLINSHKLKVILNRPKKYFHKLAAFVAYNPVRMDFIEKYPKNWFKRSDLPVTGAFKPLHISESGEIYLERNEKYFGNKPKFKYLKLANIESSKTANRLFRSRDIDININSPDSGTIDQLRHQIAFTSYMLLFNVNDKLFSELNMRRLIAKSIDRNELKKVIGRRVSPSKTLYPDFMNQKFRIPEVGNSLSIEESEFLKKIKETPIKFYTWNIGTMKTAAENILFQLKRKLDLNIELEILSHKRMLDKISRKDYQFVFTVFSSAIDDPFFPMELASDNYSSWKSKEYEKLIEKASGSMDSSKETELYIKAEKMLRDQLPVLPLLTGHMSIQVSDRVKNFQTGPLKKYLFKSAELDI